MAVELIVFHLKWIKLERKAMILRDEKVWTQANLARTQSEDGRGRKQPCLHPCLCWVDTVQELYTRHPTSSSWQALWSPSYHPRALRPASKISMSSQPQLTAQTAGICPGLTISSHPFPPIPDRKRSKRKPRCRFVQAVRCPGQGSHVPVLCDLLQLFSYSLERNSKLMTKSF